MTDIADKDRGPGHYIVQDTVADRNARAMAYLVRKERNWIGALAFLGAVLMGLFFWYAAALAFMGGIEAVALWWRGL